MTYRDKTMRLLVHNITFFIIWIRYKLGFRINKKNNKDLRINLGCGLAVTKGWINVDGSFNAFIAAMPKSIHKISYNFSGSHKYYKFDEYHNVLSENDFFQANLSAGIPANTNSADFIYTSHFLEHLYANEAKKLISDSYRVLKIGGLIRIVVPSLDYAIKLFNENKKKKALDAYFFNGGSSFDQHKYMYDYNLLHDLLKENGFSKISQCGYRTGNCPDIEILDRYPEESIFVEAIK